MNSSRRRASEISWDDAKGAADQLRWLSKTVTGLSVAAEGAVGPAALK